MKITITTSEANFGTGQSSFAVESLLCHVAHQLARGPIREMKSCTEIIRNLGGENIGWVSVEVGEPVPGKAKCDSCGTLWDEDELEPIADLHQRVVPGEIMPVGQCPDEDCGAVCHLIWEEVQA
jgi:hypothetical protein